ncbi:Helix-turn-helix motif containing protein [Oxalobacteraceae bacterium IMCC9480]|nr:Helix-turn-helix motif containing protein [Oxalobacteraceae bacterium IMCC9480]NDP58192.1 helix-turn-helix domain-containing protein [Oxalobacteraceae bacterium]
MKQKITTEAQLGQLLLGSRKAQKWTQGQLAQQAGVSQARMSALELNPGSLSVARLLLVLGAFGLEMVIQSKDADVDASHPAPAANKPGVEW